MFQNLSALKVLIIGDSMLDIYDWGKVERISPEAPVPIFNITSTENRFGGAANVAMNIKSLGAVPVLCSVIGNDISGNIFLDLLENQNLSKDGIFQIINRPTTTKRRLICGSQHIVRIDHENEKPLSEDDNQILINKIKLLLEDCKVVLFEDYDKGLISKNLILDIVTLCRKKNIPITVDPKKRNFLNYQNVTLFKPNLKELKEGLKIDFDNTNITEITEAVVLLDQKLHAENYLITLSENGVLLFSNGKSFHIAAHVREIADVSGAGDTVIAVASIFLALGYSPLKVAEMANLAGGLVCEHVGAVSIDKNILIEEALKYQILS
ncbi:MAG: D-glycero-beta-D-manno-heptose-7-phosphate kinase [Cytophagales bacterium]|nr:MAG: D-glycero-beta-D-manno-heptose-7-phosphate kinase [Cytophagales bacterium]